MPRTGLGGPIVIESIDPRIPPKFPILPLKRLHPGFRNEAWLQSMPPLGQTLEVVVMTMIDDLKGDGDPMVFNTKKGDGGEGKKREGCIPVPLYPVGRVWPSISACQDHADWEWRE